MFLGFKTVLVFIKFMQPAATDDVENLLQSVEKELRDAAKKVEEK